MKSYLSAVWHVHISMGLGDPDISSMPQLEYVVKGLTASRVSRVCRPVTPQILLKQVWELLPDRHNSVRLWAAACMCFFGFLRSGEVVVPSESNYDSSAYLSLGDVWVDSVVSPQYVEIVLRHRRQTHFAKGFRCS